MQPVSIRLPTSLIAALRVRAQASGLDVASYVRAQLTAGLDKPHNLLNCLPEAAR